MVVLVGVAAGFDIVVELRPVEGVHAYDIVLVPLLVIVEPKETEPPLQIDTPPPEIETLGTALVIPVKIMPAPVLLDAVEVIVLEPITPYFIHGNAPVYFAAAILPSVPEMSAATYVPAAVKDGAVIPLLLTVQYLFK